MEMYLLLVLSLTQCSHSAWTEWSPWSPCSRSCDGGVQYSSRDCVNDKCDGASTRYQLCNTHQPCFNSVDFRQEQCKAYDKNPYRGQLTNWVVHFDPETPCSLTCRSTESLIVRLAEKVHDGTRCREGALDLCIDGKCMPVGCDLIVGSNKTVDRCGICGGDGSSCNSKSEFKWMHKSIGECSASCGTGFKKVKYVCLDPVTEEEVEDFHCSPSEKPDTLMIPCSEEPCPVKYRWVVDNWSDCSTSCGGGSRRRLVYCGEERNNTHIRAPLHKCKGQRPRNQEACNSHECPKWYEGTWSACSATCGEGLRVRAVVCRDDRGHPTDDCDKGLMPKTSEICNSGLVCPTLLPISESSRSPKTRATEGKTPSSNRKKILDSRERFHFAKSEEDEGNRVFSDDRRRTDIDKPPKKEALMSVRNDQASSFSINNLSAEKTYSSEPSFMPEEWGPCSATCGEGFRKREVPCKIFLEFSRTLAKLPDRECPGKKPPTSEKCFTSPCPMSRSHGESWANDQSRSSKLSSEEVALKGLIPYKKPAFLSENSEEKYAVGIVYVWKISGYSSCSASCLGGVQESIIECVRTSDNQRVSHHFCSLEKRPDSITRTCNDIPCPPRWNISEFSSCNKPCGGGIQTREITCIHEVARGGSNTLPVAFELCPQPAPRTQQFCNMFDCPPSWNVGPWSKCSSPCGGGTKTRSVTCQQVVIPSSLVDSRIAEDDVIEQLGQIIDRPSSICPDHIPLDTKSCNKKPCSKVKAKINSAPGNFTYIQDPLKKKVTLKIGGRALVYKGTTINIRCPVRHFDKSRVIWYKGEDVLRTAGRLEVLKKGVLSIRDVSYSDNGIYFCRAGGTEANITLAVQMPPRKFGSSEENGLWTLGPVKGGMAIKEFVPSENDARDLSNETQDGQKNGRQNLKSKGYDLSREQMELSKNYRKQSAVDEDTNSLETELKLTADEKGASMGLTGSSLEIASDQEQIFAKFDMTSGERQGRHFGSKLKSKWAEPRLPVIDKKAKKQQALTQKILQKELGGKLSKVHFENLKFEWLLTPWSKCSQTCGGGGFQLRAAQCIARLYNSTRSVQNSLCEFAGLSPVPATHQQCGIEKCPRWQPGPWTPCEESKCFSLNTALQKRDVPCILDTGTEVDSILCNELEKPAVKRECYNDVCKGTWQVGDWSEHPDPSSNHTITS